MGPRSMLIGLTGRNASGKTTVVEWFSERGFVSESCSDSIRTWLAERGVEATRENLIEGGRELRRQGGGGILAEMLLERLNGRDAVIDSIRTPDEVDALRKREDFVLIEVVADPRIRWARAAARSRPGDPSSEAEFMESEERELEATDHAGQALIATAAMADFKIENDGDLGALGSRLNQIMSDIS